MDWNALRSRWPNSDWSQFIPHGPNRWHVQQAGSGQTILLLHGAGAATHSWDRVFAALAQTHRVIALDLPGQGFTQARNRRRCGLAEMTEDIAALLAHMGANPGTLLGHSAGAAIAVELARRFDPQPRVISVNGAFASFDGIAGVLFPAFARLLSLNPATGHLFARMTGSRSQVERLLASTGSQVPERLVDCYLALIRDPAHVNATLAMMAQWSLDKLPQSLAALTAPALFLAGENDKTVRPAGSRDAAARVSSARLELIPDQGHLMHEAAPDLILSHLREAL